MTEKGGRLLPFDRRHQTRAHGIDRIRTGVHQRTTACARGEGEGEPTAEVSSLCDGMHGGDGRSIACGAVLRVPSAKSKRMSRRFQMKMESSASTCLMAPSAPLLISSITRR